MNMLFEGLKEKGALVIVPSSAVDTMNLGGLSGMVSLAQNQGNRSATARQLGVSRKTLERKCALWEALAPES